MRAEFVIVGGGVIGAATAWELARRGAEVVLLEAERLASGASGGPGMRGIRANHRDARELPLVRLAREIWPSLAGELGADIGYRQIGELALFERAETLAKACELVLVQERAGIETRLLACDEVRALEPGVSADVIGGLLCPGDGVADHRATTLAFGKAAERGGAVAREQSRVTGFVRRDARVVGVETASGEPVVVAREVLILANAASLELVRMLGAELPIFSVLPQVLFTEPVERPALRHLLGHLERTLAAKRLEDGSMMISGGRLGQWNQATGRGETIADQVERNLADAVAVFPELEGVRLREANADRLESVGPELVPIIDRVPGVENVIVATGWTGHGFAIAPAVARLLAGWVRSGAKPEEFAPFPAPSQR